MRRRQFLESTTAALAVSAVGVCAHTGAVSSRPLDAAAYRAMRRFADLRFGRIAHVERGSGDKVFRSGPYR